MSEKPSAAAMRAAREIAGLYENARSFGANASPYFDDIAAIIDREMFHDAAPSPAPTCKHGYSFCTVCEFGGAVAPTPQPCYVNEHSQTVHRGGCSLCRGAVAEKPQKEKHEKVDASGNNADRLGGIRPAADDQGDSAVSAETPTVQPERCDAQMCPVAGGGFLYCNAPKGHEGLHSFTSQFVTGGAVPQTPPDLKVLELYYAQKDGCPKKHNPGCGKICLECVADALKDASAVTARLTEENAALKRELAEKKCS